MIEKTSLNMWTAQQEYDAYNYRVLLKCYSHFNNNNDDSDETFFLNL